MMGTRIWMRGAAGAALLGAAAESMAFGGAGGLGECTTFRSCSAAVASSAAAVAQYTFSDLHGGYVLPSGMLPGVNTVIDSKLSHTATPAVAAVGGLCLNCASDNPFLSAAI